MLSAVAKRFKVKRAYHHYYTFSGNGCKFFGKGDDIILIVGYGREAPFFFNDAPHLRRALKTFLNPETDVTKTKTAAG